MPFLNSYNVSQKSLNFSGPGSWFIFAMFENNTMKLSVDETKLTGLWARTCATFQQVMILKFSFGPEKSPGFSRYGSVDREKRGKLDRWRYIRNRRGRLGTRLGEYSIARDWNWQMVDFPFHSYQQEWKGLVLNFRLESPKNYLTINLPTKIISSPGAWSGLVKIENRPIMFV